MATIRAALLFYENLARDLKVMVFVINPHDLCVANKMFNKKNHKFAILRHVNVLKLLHPYEKEVTKVINS